MEGRCSHILQLFGLSDETSASDYREEKSIAYRASRLAAHLEVATLAGELAAGRPLRYLVLLDKFWCSAKQTCISLNGNSNH